MPMETIREAQLSDTGISWIVRAKEESDSRPLWETVSDTSSVHKTLWSLWDQIEVRNNVLCIIWESDDGRSIRWRLVLPERLMEIVLQELHGGRASGHLGVTKTLAKVKQRYYWPGMVADVRSLLRHCGLCGRRKSPAKRRIAPLQQYKVGEPMERWLWTCWGHCHFVGYGSRVMVVGDYCSKWMEAYPLPDARAETVADKFVKEFVCRFGVPLELHSDQGTNFESAVFAEMCRVLGISKTRTTAYNQKSDGMVERFNKTLINIVAMMIGPKRQQIDWDDCLPYASFAYRCTPQEYTGESPNMMVLGREVRLPVDLVVECPTVEDRVRTDFAEALRHNLQEAHTRARECVPQAECQTAEAKL